MFCFVRSIAITTELNDDDADENDHHPAHHPHTPQLTTTVTAISQRHHRSNQAIVGYLGAFFLVHFLGSATTYPSIPINQPGSSSHPYTHTYSIPRGCGWRLRVVLLTYIVIAVAAAVGGPLLLLCWAEKDPPIFLNRQISSSQVHGSMVVRLCCDRKEPSEKATESTKKPRDLQVLAQFALHR